MGFCCGFGKEKKKKRKNIALQSIRDVVFSQWLVLSDQYTVIHYNINQSNSNSPQRTALVTNGGREFNRSHSL